MHIEKMKLSDLALLILPFLIKIQETWLVDINALLLQKNWGYLMR